MFAQQPTKRLCLPFRGSHNTYDGYFRAPGFETDVPVSGPGYVRSLIDLSFPDPYFVGTQLDFQTSKVRSFVFDTRTRTYKSSQPATRRTGHAILPIRRVWTRLQTPLRMPRRTLTPIGRSTDGTAIAGRITSF